MSVLRNSFFSSRPINFVLKQFFLFFHRQTESHIFSIFLPKPFQSRTTNMATFLVLRHPVPILVTDSTNPDNLTDDLLILIVFISNCKGAFNEQKRLTSLNLSGTYQAEPSTRPPSCTTPQQPTVDDVSHIGDFVTPGHGRRVKKCSNLPDIIFE